MGMLIPLGSGHEGNPDFTVPLVSGFVGSFDLLPRGDVKTTSVEHTWKKTENGFETTGTVLLNGGRLKQILRVTSLGDKTVFIRIASSRFRMWRWRTNAGFRWALRTTKSPAAHAACPSKQIE